MCILQGVCAGCYRSGSLQEAYVRQIQASRQGTCDGRPRAHALRHARARRAQISAVIYRVPSVLLRDVHEELLPTYEYLRSLGLAEDKLCGVLRGCSPMLLFSMPVLSQLCLLAHPPFQ